MRSIAFNSGTSNVNEYPINWINHGGEICVDLTGDGITQEIYNKIKDKLIKHKLDKHNTVYGLQSKQGGFLPFLLNMLPAVSTLLPTITKLIKGNGIYGNGISASGIYGGANLGTMDYQLKLMEEGQPLYSKNISLLNGVPELIGSGIFQKLADPIKRFIDQKLLNPLADKVYSKIQERPQVLPTIEPMPHKLTPGQEIIGNGMSASGMSAKGFYGNGMSASGMYAEGIFGDGIEGGFISSLIPFIPSLISAASSIVPSVIDLFKKKGNGLYINRPIPKHGGAINSGLTNAATPVIGLSAVANKANNITGSSIPIVGHSSTIGYGSMYDTHVFGNGLKSSPCFKSDMYSEY